MLTRGSQATIIEGFVYLSAKSLPLQADEPLANLIPLIVGQHGQIAQFPESGQHFRERGPPPSGSGRRIRRQDPVATIFFPRGCVRINVAGWCLNLDLLDAVQGTQ
ncbi:MAG: hypothetical protein ACYSUI_07890 [Planctomycetota bacterium]